MSEIIPYDSIPFHLGLDADETVFIASDIGPSAMYEKSEGNVFDVNLFIDCFQKAFCYGTIVFPAYTDLLRDGDTFDSKESIPTSGALSKKVLKRREFQRTSDPLHSVLAWGRKTPEIIELKDDSTFGEGSIFSFLKQARAKMIFIDVDFNNSFTFVHYVEEALNVEYRKYFNLSIERKLAKTTDVKQIKFHTKKPGIVTQLSKLEDDLTKEGILSVHLINNSVYKIIDLKKAYLRIEEEIKSNGGKDLHSFDWMLFLKQQVKTIFGKG